ncbi:putative J domain-containing protein C63.13 [Cladobotryum mycophilum]|uniref:J domain-containing protein C63.13 n=1 Tax=Cladobotryum mycophilum TaxID=491253 RepID=A0ABR0SFG4_9HYPO
MASRTPPDYYGILGVGEKASTTQVRDAYKRAALKTHPDRVANDSSERTERTRKFQLVNDAYYTLSDPTRRKDYDDQRRLFKRPAPTPADPCEDPAEEVPPDGNQGPNVYSWAWDFFTKQSANYKAERERTDNAQFGNVFEEMMREEGMAEEGTNRPTSKFWGMVGAMSGGALGFIVGNVPGLVAGAVAGNRLGAIRDAKGKSVYEVYQELPQTDKARLLSQLAAKVFSHVAGI